MSNQQVTESATGAPNKHEATHVGEEFTETIAFCQQKMLDTPELNYLAHYSDGIYDFAVDRLGAVGEQSPHGRRLLRRIGRQLAFRMQDLDEMLRPPRTGALLRLVLQYPSGYVVCTSVLPRVHLVGYSLTALREDAGAAAADTEPVDRSMVALVTALRRRIGLPSLNPGGFEETPSGSQSAGPLLVEQWSGAEQVAVANACRNAVRHEDLHFVAYTVNGVVKVMDDCLSNPRLRSHFTQISVKARRQYYKELAGEINEHVAHFNLIVSSALDGNFVRAVYDVEQGAIFSHRVAPGKLLMGVTLKQDAERAAETRLGELADHCRKFLGD